MSSNHQPRRLRWPLAAMILLFPAMLSAADAVPHVFFPGTRILSSQVNENFAHVLREIDEKQDKLLGGSLSGTVHGKAALTVINQATVPPNGCFTDGGGAINAETSAHFCGDRGYAAIRGMSHAKSFGVGVLGAAGDATSDYSVGVLGMAAGTNAAAVATWGSGLRLNGGGMRTNTEWNPMAFAHVASAANTQGHVTCIDQPLTNEDPNAVLTVSHRLARPPVYLRVPIGLQYDDTSKKWCIHAEDGATSLVGHTFNVIVVNTFSSPPWN